MVIPFVCYTQTQNRMKQKVRAKYVGRIEGEAAGTLTLFDSCLYPRTVFRQALVVLVIEALTLNDPESIKVLLAKRLFDFSPIYVGFCCSHFALDIHTVSACLGHLAEVFENLLTLFNRQFFHMRESRPRLFLIGVT